MIRIIRFKIRRDDSPLTPPPSRERRQRLLGATGARCIWSRKRRFHTKWRLPSYNCATGFEGTLNGVTSRSGILKSTLNPQPYGFIVICLASLRGCFQPCWCTFESWWGSITMGFFANRVEGLGRVISPSWSSPGWICRRDQRQL